MRSHKLRHAASTLGADVNSTSLLSLSRIGRSPAASARSSTGFWLGLAALALAFLWSYAPTLATLIVDWRTDPNYSAGQIVPVAALYLLWHDRARLAQAQVRPCWWGLAVILAAQALRAYGLLRVYESAERYSLVLTLSGVVLLMGGRDLFRRTLWLQCFLLLMVPLPGRLHNAIASPLQSFATQGAVYTLELLGIGVAREGNVMLLNNRLAVAVAEACSGLRMLTAFVVVSAVFAYLVRRPSWQKAVLLASSVLIAIACNLIRLVITAVLFLTTRSEVAERFFHDCAGLTMMPMAVLMLAGELWLMSHLVIEEKHDSNPNPTAM